MRVGVHQGQVVLEMDRGGTGVADVYGLQVSTAARIMDLAQGDQILLSRAVFDDARAILSTDDFPGFPPLAWRNHGPYCFKGVEDSHEVCEVGEEGAALLAPPPASAQRLAGRTVGRGTGLAAGQRRRRARIQLAADR